MADSESISLEGTNKIRISLGLKPVTDDKAPATDKEKEAEDNYSRVRKRDAKEKTEKALRDKIAKVRNKHELNAKLKGATLGDPDEDDGDTMAWLKKSKKREKELAKKRQRELEEMDTMFQEKYDEDDLAGMKVRHDFEGLAEGEEHILTLKDSRILDNEEDELHNVLLADHKHTDERMELKTKNRGYTGFDDDEFVNGQAGIKRSILGKYDDELNGAQETGFRLGSAVKTSKVAREEKQEAAAAVNKSLLTIDYAKNQEMSDYIQQGDSGFKKPKKKKKQSSRRVQEAETNEEDPDGMVVDAVPPTQTYDDNFVDDEELQAALARSRKAKMKKMPKLTPEEIARKIAEEKEEEERDALESMKVEEDDKGLTIDDTSEFVQSITLEPKAEPRVLVIPTVRPSEVQKQEDSDTEMGDGDGDIDGVEIDIKTEEEMQAALLALEDAFGPDAAETITGDVDIGVGTASEGSHNTGMAGTLNILRQQGALQATPGELQTREKTQKERDLWLAEQRTRIAKRELDRIKARGANKDQQQREYENRLREQQEVRGALESFKNYKPDVNIVYHDEFGRVMTPKEAWKALSHRFHGKGSGKMKTEKRLKRIAEEHKAMAMNSGDTPLSMTKAFQMRQEKLGQAHMVLSVGNRGAAPQLGQYVEENPTLTKPKAAKKGKKAKEADKMDSDANQLIDVTHFVTAPAIQQQAATSSTPAPAAPRAGFTKVGTFVAHPAPSNGQSPIGGGKIALNLKRKAEDDGTDTPPSKRR